MDSAEREIQKALGTLIEFCVSARIKMPSQTIKVFYVREINEESAIQRCKECAVRMDPDHARMINTLEWRAFLGEENFKLFDDFSLVVPPVIIDD